jgi:hypothetical protein
MKHISSDVDKLMWTIAESGDMKAADDFENRFPDLRLELAKRFTMVRNLRGANPIRSGPAVRPVFRPNPVAQPLCKKPFFIGGGMLGLAAIAAASYVVTSMAMAPKPAPVKSYVPPVIVQTPKTPEITYVAPGPSPNVSLGKDPVPNTTSTPVPKGMPLYANVPPATGHPSDVPKSEKPQTVVMSKVPLQTVLSTITDGCGIQIDEAPGLANPTVDADYRNMTGKQILKELGDKYGFGLVEEGKDRVLLVPLKTGTTADGTGRADSNQ